MKKNLADIFSPTMFHIACGHRIDMKTGTCSNFHDMDVSKTFKETEYTKKHYHDGCVKCLPTKC